MSCARVSGRRIPSSLPIRIQSISRHRQPGVDARPAQRRRRDLPAQALAKGRAARGAERALDRLGVGHLVLELDYHQPSNAVQFRGRGDALRVSASVSHAVQRRRDSRS
jgi:hypothetical protein